MYERYLISYFLLLDGEIHCSLVDLINHNDFYFSFRDEG